MATVDQIPMPIPTTTRDREIEKMKRSFRVRVPDADTGDNSPVDTDARMLADIVMPLYAAARINNDQTVLENARGAAQDAWAARHGVEPRREAFGASGAVIFAGNTGGATIATDDEIKHESSGMRYSVLSTDHYIPGDPISIVGKDTGPATNLPAGTQLKWTSPRSGSGDYAIVATGGLSGGRDKENDDEFYLRIKNEMQTRAASGNDAEYQLEAEKTPGVAMQKSFTHPGILSSGTMCLVFTMLPEHPGGSRIPNSTQVGLVESHVTGEFPADDGAMFGMVANQNADVVYAMDFANGWADLAPWPRYYAASPSSGPGAVRVTAATSATAFTLGTSNGIYIGAQQPTVGQTFAFYDQASFTFRHKRILSFTGTGPWVVTCDTTNNASDTSYTPVVGQRACPWSDSLDSILYTAAIDNETPASGVLAYFDTLGPGEQVVTFYDEGSRQRRQPQPPTFWPHTLTTRGLLGAITTDEVIDVDVLEGDGVAPSVGTPGVLSRILQLRWLSVFPKTT
jgi:uncharacterized phage protein gp47/JayE